MAYYSPILKITDGTPENTVDLLNGSTGYILCDWRPASPTLSYNYISNPVSGIKRPNSSAMYPNADTLTLSLRDSSGAGALDRQRKLFSVLQSAIRYWTSDKIVDRPYYLMVRPKDVQTTMYATIFSVTFPDSGNPFSQPFATNAKLKAMTDLALVIEHDFYSPVVPGYSMAGNADGSIVNPYENEDTVGYSLDSIYGTENPYGYPDYSFVAAMNHGAITQLEYVWKSATWTNLIGYGSPAPTLFSGTGAYTYFGIEYADLLDTYDNHQFNAIAFVPSTTNTSTPATFVFERYMGGWIPLDVMDTTNGFTKPGIISWPTYLPQSRATVNSVYGRWVRAKITGGTSQMPRVQTPPYVVGWNMFTVPSSAKGDAGARLDMRFSIGNWGTTESKDSFDYHAEPTNIIIGGSQRMIYTHISPAHFENKNGTPFTGAMWNTPYPSSLIETGTWYTDITPYSNAVFVRPNPNAPNYAEYLSGQFTRVAQVTFTNSGNNMYSGNFRAFVRFHISKYTGAEKQDRKAELPSMSMFAEVANRNGIWDGTVPDEEDPVVIIQKTPMYSFTNISQHTYALDLGVITLGDPGFSGRGNINMYQSVIMNLRYDNAAALGSTLNLDDLVLIPVDEYYMEMYIPKTLVPNFAESKNYVRDIIINTASSIGELEGFSAIHDGSEFNGVSQFKNGVLSFPVGAPMHLYGDGNSYLYFFSYIESTNGLHISSLSDQFPIDIAVSPMYTGLSG